MLRTSKHVQKRVDKRLAEIEKNTSSEVNDSQKLNRKGVVLLMLLLLKKSHGPRKIFFGGR